jgi:nitroreductase
VLVRDRAAIARIAALGDDASMHFLRDSRHRRELREWMRLTRAHPDWSHDGLSAEAMALSPVEARAAGLVLRPLFGALDGIGLARLLLSERTKTASASAIALFVRPIGEPAIETGRALYRAWLAMERHGLAACPMSVLADWEETNRLLAAEHHLAPSSGLVGVFRLGPRPRRPYVRARWEPQRLILSGTGTDRLP